MNYNYVECVCFERIYVEIDENRSNRDNIRFVDDTTPWQRRIYIYVCVGVCMRSF